MKRTILCTPILLLWSLAHAQVATPELNQRLTQAAQQLSTATFDPKATVSVKGHVSTLVWPEGTVGMIVLQASDGKTYAFSTAGVPAMAKQGFTRFAMHPGEEVTITGLLAPAQVGPGFIAARADTITKADGSRAFDRAKLPEAR